jgi:hypothetical protein
MREAAMASARIETIRFQAIEEATGLGEQGNRRLKNESIVARRVERRGTKRLLELSRFCGWALRASPLGHPWRWG